MATDGCLRALYGCTVKIFPFSATSRLPTEIGVNLLSLVTVAVILALHLVAQTRVDWVIFNKEPTSDHSSSDTEWASAPARDFVRCRLRRYLLCFQNGARSRSFFRLRTLSLSWPQSGFLGRDFTGLHSSAITCIIKSVISGCLCTYNPVHLHITIMRFFFAMALATTFAHR